MRRGDVFRLRLGRRQGHEQSVVRYGVVVQSDALLRLSTVLIAPTSTSARAASFRPEIEIDGTLTRVLVEQTGASTPRDSVTTTVISAPSNSGVWTSLWRRCWTCSSHLP